MPLDKPKSSSSSDKQLSNADILKRQVKAEKQRAERAFHAQEAARTRPMTSSERTAALIASSAAYLRKNNR